MKNIKRLNVDLDKFSKRLIHNLKQAQSETADKIKEDVVKNSGISSGEYIESIKKSPTKVNTDTITTEIYTDLKSKDGYFIGRMIENGTGIYALEPHIGHTKTFYDSGYKYWYVPADDVKRPIGREIEINGIKFYIAKAQRPKPHWKPALEQNTDLYKQKIHQALEEAKKWEKQFKKNCKS